MGVSKKSSSILLVIFFLGLFLSCTSPEDGSEINQFSELTNSFNYEIDTLEVKSGTSLGFTKNLYSPVGMIVNGENLLVFDLKAQEPLWVYNLESNEYEGSYSRRGRGPNEFRRIFSFNNYPASSDNIWIYDFPLNRFTEVELNDDSDDVLSFKNTINIEATEGPMLSPHWMNDTTIVGIGFFQKGRLLEYDSLGKVRTYKSEPVQVLQNSESIFLNNRALQGRAKSHPNLNNYVVVNRYTNQIEIYNKHLELQHITRGPEYFLPGFEVQGEELKGTSDRRYAYIDVETSNEYIYTLYSGSQSEADQPNFGQFIHIFDWQGQLRKAFQLDTKIIGIAIDENSNYLYGIQHLPEVDIKRYRLWN